MTDLTQVRKLIKKCKKTQNPYLDLGKCEITDLNELPELFECIHLEALILSNSWRENDIRKESSNKGENNILFSIPEEISNLKKLTHLILGDWESSWRISDYSFLEKMTGLQFLDLSRNQIKEIPEFIFKLNMEIYLEKYGGKGLSLYGNPIESPPIGIIRQGRLSVLDWFGVTKKK